MAHTKQQGAANRHIKRPGKRLGVKKFAGEFVKPGNIIIRQKGSKFHSGKNVYIGKDYTISAKIEGKVNFRNMTGHHKGQKYVDVLPEVTQKKAVKRKSKPLQSTAGRKSSKPIKATEKKKTAKK